MFGGHGYGAARVGTSNANTYWQKGVCPMLAWGCNVFYFESMEELWKSHSVGNNGAATDEKHWDAMMWERQAKFSLKC